MLNKGQIIEIPANSPIYNNNVSYKNKEQEFLNEINKRAYSLFDGFIIGEHYGIDRYNLGQRKGINVGGKSKPLYVIGIDKNENRLFVGQGAEHPGLYTKLINFNKFDMFYNDKNFINLSKYIIQSPVIKSEIFAKFYSFNEMNYLELSSNVHIDIINYPINLLDENEIKIIIIK